MGVRPSLMVTFAAIRLRGPTFKPRPGQKLEPRFLLHAHPVLRLMGPQHWVPEPIPSLETHHQQVKGRSNGCRYVYREEDNTNEIQWQVKSEWKNTEIWKVKGKAMDTNTGGSPGYQSQPCGLETHLVRK